MILKLLLSAFFAAFAAAAAVALEKRDAKVIKMDLYDGSSLAKRDADYGSSNVIIAGYMLTEVKVGSNKDAVTLILDTGSWLTQIFDSNVTCPSCKGHGLYNSSASTSVVKSGKHEYSGFGGDSHFAGESAKEDFYLGEGDFKVSNVTFNDVYDSKGFGYGILGLALPPSDALDENLAWAAKHSGEIDKAAYSLILQNRDDSQGSLIVGGYDAAKIDGDIHWTSIKDSNIHAILDYIKLNGTKIPVNKSYTLDSGGPTANLPKAVFDQVIANLPVEQDGNKYYFDCSYGEGKTITYNLNGVDYDFPYTVFSRPTGKDNKCEITYAVSNAAQLGAHMFRYLFIAVDLEDSLLGLASTKNTTETDIRAF
ncbi:Candidapepsin-1 [Candida viswanathii]|uniref:Candidapepsin-1 n=1 Tax=Candida viswanathii TaxID=5486 RepID=A0A367XZ94_9ASCO|nr:Candidapepsin-1 [Candida viswanathii]